jgi:biotin synthase
MNEERSQTLDHIEKSGISVCCGGIIGLGETVEDPLQL